MHIYIDIGNVVITSFGTMIPKFAFQVRGKLGFAGDTKQKIEIECQNENIAGDFDRPVIKKKLVARLKRSRAESRNGVLPCGYCTVLPKSSRTQGTTAPKSR